MGTIPFNRPRIVFVTAQASFVPGRYGNNSDNLNFKIGGFAGFLSNLISDLDQNGADVHQFEYRLCS